MHSQTATLPPPSPKTPGTSASSSTPLLLKGDDFYVSRDGVARTFYQLVVPSGSCQETVPISIEEVHHLRTARKTYLLRETASPTLPSPRASALSPASRGIGAPSDGLAPTLGCIVAQLDLQEVDPRGAAGTGGTTWEASIAMALYFACRPLELTGHVIELGSGLGVGGILVNLGPRWNKEFSPALIESITLTDSNDVVLRHCRSNVANVEEYFPTGPPMHVLQLEWNDVVDSTNADAGNVPVVQRYDTVLACDCVYRHEDVPVLAQALANLLADGPKAKIHLFSPYNRSPLSDLVKKLKDLGLYVEVEPVEMNRYRLRPPSRNYWWHSSGAKTNRDPALQECSYVSKAAASFVHVTAQKNTSRAYCSPLGDVD